MQQFAEIIVPVIFDRVHDAKRTAHKMYSCMTCRVKGERAGMRLRMTQQEFRRERDKQFSTEINNAGRLTNVAAMSAMVSSQLRPAETCAFDCDWSPSERWINMLTSLPYALVGMHMFRNTKRRGSKLYAASQVSVGAAAFAYHASKGRARVWCRRGDYWSIALGSIVMTNAVFPQMPRAVSVAGMAATPFLPFVVSSANTMAMELEYLRRAVGNEHLRKDHLVHCLAGAAGLALFALDEIHPHIPCCHAAWHALSCLSVTKTLPLIQDIERGDSMV